MDSKKVIEKAYEILVPVVENLGYDLVECEFLMDSGRWVLRLYIDKEDGIKVEDCERVSRGVGDLIEIEELVPIKYTLEVSSPGINRPLRRRKDFERFQGSQIKLKTLNPIDGRSNYKGTLIGLDGEEILMVVDGSEYRIPLNELSKARVEEEISMKSKRIN